MSIAISYTEITLQAKATILARQLCLPLVEIDDPSYDFLLVYNSEYLELKHNTPKAPGAVYVDFLSSTSQYRRMQVSRNNELLAKALGIKSHYRPTVIDATAGLGSDAFIMACLGCKVQMIERSPIIAALLQDGIARLLADDRFKNLDFALVNLDAVTYLKQLNPQNYPDVIYLDPMYPEQNKTALAKKEMRMLRAIVGDDLDADNLLPIALKVAQKRVVVKRHRHATVLAGMEPSHTINGRSQRFDVYLK